MTEMQTIPQTNGEAPLPKHQRPKGLLPVSWIGRTLRVAYVDCYGDGQETSGTLLDIFPAGPVLNIGGAKTLISWERLVLAELIED